MKACGEIDHIALMGRVRRRIADKHVLGLVKTFLKAGILGEDGLDSSGSPVSTGQSSPYINTESGGRQPETAGV